MTEKIRTFDSGATRNSSICPVTGLPKLSYRGFFSPQVLKRRAEYMNKHRVQEDGSLRAPDNWKKGIPLDVYLESLLRHVQDVWCCLEGDETVDLEDSLCGVSFNSDGMLHEVLKKRQEIKIEFPGATSFSVREVPADYRPPNP